MSMKELTAHIRQQVNAEYGRAAEKYGAKHASRHEAYAVMREEFQEAVEALNEVGGCLEEKFWTSVRKDTVQESDRIAQEIYDNAVLAACECVQTAAMAYKCLKGYERKDKQ